MPFAVSAQCLPDDWEGPASWTEPYPAHRVIGNLYAVGAADRAVYLLTSDAGLILINSGLEESVPFIRDNIVSLGFRLEDVKIMLQMQAHFDHTAAMAEIQALTGAEVWTTPDDARILEDGGTNDPPFGHCETYQFAPVEVARIIRHGDVIELGDIRLDVHEHPGHTEGSSSYTMVVNENGRNYNVAIANMGTINSGKRLLVEPTYDGVAEDFATTYRRQKAMDIDVWVAAHGSQYNLEDKHVPGQAYSPDTFVDPDGFFAEVESLERDYLEQLAEERNQN